jgi:AraC family transcriptional regulator
MQPILAAIAAKLDEDISLDSLAAQARLSPFHLQRVFSEAIGESPKQFTIRLRLGRAAILLLTSNETILDIALACGFQTHESFTRAFHRRFGLAPIAYRNRGFIHPANATIAKIHAATHEQIAPCLSLYRMTETKPEPARMEYSITTKEITAKPALVVQRKIQRSEIAAAIQSSLRAVGMYAQRNGVAFAGAPFARFISMGPGLITMETGMPIAVAVETIPNDDGVKAITLPGGLVATGIHTGPYDLLPDAWGFMHQWMEANHHTPGSEAPWESYITDPGQIPDPKDWKTELFWPLQG